MIDVERIKQFLRNNIAIWHCRYSTSGDWKDHANNQPIKSGQRVIAANCVISMKAKAEYEQEYGIACDTDNDAEIFLKRIEKGIREEIIVEKGAFAGVWIENGKIRAIRNNYRPLYISKHAGATWVMSTADAFYRTTGKYPRPIDTGKVVIVNDA